MHPDRLPPTTLQDISRLSEPLLQRQGTICPPALL